MEEEKSNVEEKNLRLVFLLVLVYLDVFYFKKM